MDRIETMPDDLTRLARNGSQKVPSRFISPLRDAIAKETPYDHIAFAVAAWMCYLKGIDPQGNPFDINDEEGLRMGLHDIAHNSNGDPHPLLAVQEIFGSDLSLHKEFTGKVQKWLPTIEHEGMLAALRKFGDELKQVRPKQDETAKPSFDPGQHPLP